MKARHKDDYEPFDARAVRCKLNKKLPSAHSIVPFFFFSQPYST